MGGGRFTFKQFIINQERCAMKVGTDGVLIGAWSRLPHDGGRILDIGTGTGLIALMAAQRCAEARITAIDIDEDCVLQASENAAASAWSERIEILHCALQEFMPTQLFDTIISNPPYFVDSLQPSDNGRLTARHAVTLTFEQLAASVLRLLKPQGTLSLILPPVETERFISTARGRLYPVRRCEVWSTPDSGAKRIMTEFTTQPVVCDFGIEKLVIEDKGPMGYSDAYRDLTRDFYLKF